MCVFAACSDEDLGAAVEFTLIQIKDVRLCSIEGSTCCTV